MNRNLLSNALRHTRLIYSFDHLRFHFERSKNRSKNKEFLKENPGIALPPDYLMYESFQLDYRQYFTESRNTAQWLYALFLKHGLKEPARVLDWGCGPARIIRHLPALMSENSRFFGTDYNLESVAWCQNNIPGIEFSRNTLKPPLAYDKDSFDAIYGISIFTHLSEEMHMAWSEELQRVLNPGGLLLLTSQGESFKTKLLDTEIRDFEQGKLVVRGKVREGHRTFSAFHPPAYFKGLFQDMEVMEHLVRKGDKGKPQQDVWIFRKR
jgi:ubiquinone/menaquinone biosynthesis C-methylase UbiE